MDSSVGFVWLFIYIVLYLLPYIIAAARKKKNTNAILILNLFLGWTFVGWIVCLVWAVKNDLIDKQG